MKKTLNIICCDATDCKTEAPEGAKDWTTTLFYPNGQTRLLHLCPEHSNMTIAEATAMVTPKPPEKTEKKA